MLTGISKCSLAILLGWGWWLWGWCKLASTDAAYIGARSDCRPTVLLCLPSSHPVSAYQSVCVYGSLSLSLCALKTVWHAFCGRLNAASFYRQLPHINISWLTVICIRTAANTAVGRCLANEEAVFWTNSKVFPQVRLLGWMSSRSCNIINLPDLGSCANSGFIHIIDS